jgi:uncharacterized protein (DUF1697 family)
VFFDQAAFFTSFGSLGILRRKRMEYLALLRGINVGGKNKIPMPELLSVCQDRGLERVETYINTGNILFSSQKSPTEVAVTITQGIAGAFGLDIPVLVLEATTFLKVAQAIPDDWSNDKVQKADVWFLWAEYDKAETLELLPLQEGIDQASYVPGAILWSVSRANQGKSRMNKVVGTKLYKSITIRNVNTVRKIATLLQARN